MLPGFHCISKHVTSCNWKLVLVVVYFVWSFYWIFLLGNGAHKFLICCNFILFQNSWWVKCQILLGANRSLATWVSQTIQWENFSGVSNACLASSPQYCIQWLQQECLGKRTDFHPYMKMQGCSIFSSFTLCIFLLSLKKGVLWEMKNVKCADDCYLHCSMCVKSII
jgi:hypothetical protein